MIFCQINQNSLKLLDEFLLFIKDKKLIIHNVDFDLSHLNNELKLLGKKLDNQVIDTLILARDKFPGSSISLDALCKRYRIDNSKEYNTLLWLIVICFLKFILT